MNKPFRSAFPATATSLAALVAAVTPAAATPKRSGALPLFSYHNSVSARTPYASVKTINVTNGSATKRYELAPEGTYIGMVQQLAMFKQQLDAMFSDRSTYGARDWLGSLNHEIDNLPLAAIGDEVPPPSPEVLAWAKDIAALCARVGVSEPSVTHGDTGDLEIFVKESGAALLLVVRPDGVLQVFGDSNRDQWRARYTLTGSAWSRYLRSYLDDLKFKRA